MVCGRDKAASQCVHFGQRAYFPGIAEIVYKFSSGKAGAGCGFHGNELVILFSSEDFAHKRGNQPSQVGSAACAADDDIRYDIVFIKGGLCFQSDYGLVKQYLGKNAS